MSELTVGQQHPRTVSQSEGEQVTEAPVGASPEAIREFVAEHFRRIPDCKFEHVTSGWRVRFGRPMDSQEARIASEAYDAEDFARAERIEAARLAAEARKPKGPINRFLAMGWKGQMGLGLVIFLVALYAGCIALYPVVGKTLLAGGTAATGSSSLGPSPALSPGGAGLTVELFDHPGIQAATSILFWAVLVTGGVGGVVILFISWGIGYAIVRGCRALLRRPEAPA